MMTVVEDDDNGDEYDDNGAQQISICASSRLYFKLTGNRTELTKDFALNLVEILCALGRTTEKRCAKKRPMRIKDKNFVKRLVKCR